MSASRHPRYWRALPVALLLLAGLLVQLRFVARYPQPALFGDPGAYHFVGLELRDAIGRWRAGEDAAAALDSVRPYLYLGAVGSVYAAIESTRGLVRRGVDSVFEGGAQRFRWLRPLPFFRVALALVNVAGMLGAFVLGWQLSGRYAGGIVSLALAAVYPSFALQIGRLYPEPVFCTTFVWASVCYHRAVTRSSWRWMAAAGCVLGAGFFFRAQLMNYFPILLALWLAASAPLWLRRREARVLVLALVLATVPSMLAWKALTSLASDDFSKIEEFGFFHFPEQHLYPYGFWQLLEADGWMGAYQLRQDPFYLAMVDASEDEPDLLRSRPRQLAFTIRYVAARLGESVLLVLDNIYRTHDRPANNYQWDYPVSTTLQAWLQKAVVLAAIRRHGARDRRVACARRVFFVPLSLALLFGMSTPQPRYGQPSMLIVIAAAGAFCVSVAPRLAAALRTRVVRITLGSIAALALVGVLARSGWPEGARVLRASAVLGVSAAPLVLAVAAYRERRHLRLVATVLGAALVVVVSAHLIRDRSWHEVRHELGGDTVEVEQEIRLSSSALARLRNASEAFVVFDLHAPSGDLDGVQVRVGDRTFAGDRLVPTMVDMAESTTSGGRNPTRYRQWWALPLPRDDRALPARAPATLTVGLSTDGSSPLSLFADRFRDQERVYDGPSFGDTPHTSAPKLEYHGDYRLPYRTELASAATSSYALGGDGERRELADRLRVRVVTLASNEGGYAWESSPLGSARALGFHAFAHGVGDAELLVAGEPVLRFPLGSERDFDVEGSGYALCYRADAARGDNEYGAYVLRAPASETGPLSLEVRFRSGMTRSRRFFSVDADAPPPDGTGCFGGELAIAPGIARVVDASRNSYPRDTGRWRVREVF